MSKRAVIHLNNDPLGFDHTVDKLRTSSIDGSSITWIPEDESRCESLHVTENGTYQPGAGHYGYDYVTVSVNGGSVTGKDGDGDEAAAHADPDTGRIVIEKIPSKIRITTQPTKKQYRVGETIDFSGAVVKAYLLTGGVYGTVPTNQITLSPTRAGSEPEQTITVSWQRPGDGAVLETTYTITVTG